MVKIFISYAHRDKEFKDELEKHLAPFKLNGMIESWNDQEILPGAEWDREIKTEIENSQLILFLISSDFIASQYINDEEISRALDRYRKREVVIIPIILRPTDYSSLEISKFQALPRDGQPISTWKDRDAAWVDVISHLKKVFVSLNEGHLKLRERSSGVRSRSIQYDNNANTIDAVRTKIANSRTDEALKILLSISKESGDDDLYNQIIMLKSRYSSLKKNKMLGIISSNNLEVSEAQINYSILSLLKDIEQ